MMLSILGCPDSKIIFLSADNSADVVQAALSIVAHGFVHKAGTATELLSALETAHLLAIC